MSSPASVEDLQRALEECTAARLHAEQQLADAQARVDEMRAEMQGFAYAAGHDLREPLRAISAYSQLIQKSLGEDASNAEYFRFIRDGVNTANKLIEGLLNFSRAGASTSRTEISLDILARMAVMTLQAEIDRSKASVTLGSLPVALVNESDVKRVFEHLIDNAIKYHGPGVPSIHISAEEIDDSVEVQVLDNGPGIDPKFHKDVFLPFKRLHGKEIPGSGLGLAISRKIVNAHGGSIWVGEDNPTGASLRFTLPR
jgi:light-regulated signal transduction histidine kinase (bacteriophytochrome)